MISPCDVAVIIPALNESATIGDVIRQASGYGCKVYVVDDNSTDSTPRDAAAAGATVLRLPYTAGAWMAVQAGMHYAVNHGSQKYFITMDADGQHIPSELPGLIAAFESQGVNTIIGSCPERGSRARRIAWKLFSFMTHLPIVDITSGFRMYDRKSLDVLLTGAGALLDYQDVGVLLLLRRNGVRYGEFPVAMCRRESGHSRIFDSWFDVGRYLLKTLFWIIADWIARIGRKPRELKKYDAF